MEQEKNKERITIKLPLEVFIPRKTREDKKIIMNLNIYRNTHYMTLNAAKVEMKEHVRLAIGNAGDADISPPYLFTYTVFPATGRKFDLGNVCSIIQKFTDDALIDIGVIKDDNYKVVNEVRYRFGGIDKTDPRAELTIEPMRG